MDTHLQPPPLCQGGQASITVCPRSPLRFLGVVFFSTLGDLQSQATPSPSYTEPKGRIWGTLPAEQGAPFYMHLWSVLWGLPGRFVSGVHWVTPRRGAELLETITILLANPPIFPLWRLGH